MNKKMNNKGFSLVELIIVIAIMVVLIAVLAPQYLKYVEKSRVASDQTTIVEYINAMQVLASDPDVTLDSTKTYSLTNSSDTLTVNPDLKQLFIDEAILDSASAGGGKLQSTAYSSATVKIILTYNTGDKIWEVKNNGGTVEVSGKIQTTP